jgi:hypothetical protein
LKLSTRGRGRTRMIHKWPILAYAKPVVTLV